MTFSELELLLDRSVRDAVEANIDRDPVRIALDRRIPAAATVATQVKYLQRARRKLPSYYRAGCILPPVAFEQASSEECAAHKSGGGETCLDMTCGLGVDAFYLSRRFGRVVAVERDPVLAAVARENFRRLGADNIEVICDDAERVAARGGRYDMIYADPDRRDSAGRRQVLLERCSPDIAAMLPQLQRLAPHITVKNSPLFDVQEARRIFGGRSRVEAVSLGGECKEVIAEWRAEGEGTLAAAALGCGTFEIPWPEVSAPVFAADPRGARYLFSPDAALRKARLTASYFARYAPSAEACTADGFYLGRTAGEALPLCRTYEVLSAAPFSPKALRRDLARRGIGRITVLKRDLGLSAAEVCRRLGVAEGGERLMAVTECGGGIWAFELKELTLPKQPTR